MMEIKRRTTYQTELSYLLCKPLNSSKFIQIHIMILPHHAETSVNVKKFSLLNKILLLT